MNKQAFLEELTRRLSGLSQSDLEERLAFYGEMIDDKVEDGLSEEEAVAGIGSVDDVVSQIMSEIPLSRLVKEKCDFTASIPMKGDIDSLNASVAAGILAWEIVRQNRQNGKH